ncbi:hypothetical protein ACVWW2_001311 [Bradyrhizobium sp. LM4.3]
MAKIGKPSEPPKTKTKTAENKAKQPPPPREIDDDYEDGDFATPKRDRHGVMTMSPCEAVMFALRPLNDRDRSQSPLLPAMRLRSWTNNRCPR